MGVVVGVRRPLEAAPRTDWIALVAMARDPFATPAALTSMTKTKTGACGGRTMYSTGATNSTLPRLSSGREAASTRTPCASKGA